MLEKCLHDPTFVAPFRFLAKVFDLMQTFIQPTLLDKQTLVNVVQQCCIISSLAFGLMVELADGVSMVNFAILVCIMLILGH